MAVRLTNKTVAEEPAAAKAGVSKDGAAEVAASWFETRGFAALLTMRSREAIF